MFAVELLIFDLDGTLCDTKDDIATSVNLTLKELGLCEKPLQDIYRYVGSGVRSLLQQALDAAPSHGVPLTDLSRAALCEGGEGSDERFKEAMRVFRNHYLEHLLDTTKLYPGMERVLDHFKHKKKAVVTNKPQQYTDRILEGLGLIHHFDLIVGGDNGLFLKPEPQMILFALDQLQVEKTRCVMIGDGLHDIAAARAAGVKSCAVGYGLGNARELKEAGPDFFCRQPEELTSFFE